MLLCTLLCMLLCMLLFSGFECWMDNSTVYIPESGGRAEVKINPKDSVELLWENISSRLCMEIKCVDTL